MLRLPPFDKIGTTPVPDFTNADPTNSVPGSIVNGQVFNQLQHEGENLELLAGLSPSGTDLTQWAQAASRRGIWCGQLTGTGDLAVATLGAVLPALLQGMGIGAVASAANTVTNPKLRITNLGSTSLFQDFPILKEDGSALAIGEIKAGRRYRYEADGAGNVLISGGGIGLSVSQSTALTIVKAAGTSFNTTALPSTQRNSASASAAGALVPVVTVSGFSKLSSTSLLRIGANFYAHSPVVPGQGNGAVTVRATLTVVATGQTFTDDRPVNCTNLNAGGGAFGSGGNTQRFRFANVPAGALSLTLSLKRDDNLSWTTIYGATGADLSGLPTPNPSLFEIDEVESLS